MDIDLKQFGSRDWIKLALMGISVCMMALGLDALDNAKSDMRKTLTSIDHTRETLSKAEEHLQHLEQTLGGQK